jgi:large repetitive protein
VRNAAGTVIGTALVNSANTWTLTPVPTFSVGNGTLSVSSTLGSSTLSGNTVSVSVSPATNCAPTHNAPTLNALSDVTLACGQTTTTNVSLSGNGTPGASVSVANSSGTVVATTTVNANGSWSVVSSSVFQTGSQTLTATSTLGSSVLPGTPRTFVVRSATECGPTHNAPTLAPVSNITLACGSTSSLVNFSGSGTPGATITLKNVSNATVSTVIVNASGSWSSASWTLLPVGSYTIRAESTLGTQTISGGSTTFSVIAATNCGGGGPTLVAPYVAPVTSLALACGQTGSTVNFSGTGTVGSTISLYSGSTLVATTLVTNAGTWSAVSSTALPAGSYIIRSSTSLGGQTLDGNSVVFTIVSPTGCNPPVQTHVAPFINTQSNITLSCGQSSTSVTFSGTGSSGATITLRDGLNSILGTAVVGSNNIWSIIPANYIAGSYSATVSSTLAGNTLAGNTVSFTVT